MTTIPGSRDDVKEVQRFIEHIKSTADKFARDQISRGDTKLAARALGELRYSFKILAKYRDKRKVTVFGSARTPPEHPHYQLAVDFGKAVADAGFMVITGAGPGIMEAGHVGAGADMSIGINILLPFEQDANEVIADDDKLINLNYFFTRKLLFLKETDALVLFPGGFGTLDEGFEALTLLQTGKAEMMPVVLIDVPGGEYWKHWENYVRHSVYEDGMISEQDFSLFKITDSVEEAIEEITGFYRVYHSLRYVRGELALRLKRELSNELVDRIQAEFSDILADGSFRTGPAHPDEANEPKLINLPRLYFPFDRKSLGRLRELIDFINREA